MAMGPDQRQELGLHALAGTVPISRLAAEHEVSRKFIYRQRTRANEALHDAFCEEESPADQVLFYLPVTEDWLDQLILGLTLTCHSSIRGVGELCRDLLDYPISVGKVHEVLQRAVTQARQYNHQQPLAAVRIGAHDEIFQSGRPVLVGADVDSTYCYLLSLEDHRDGDTWGLRLLELQDRGFHPEAALRERLGDRFFAVSVLVTDRPDASPLAGNARPHPLLPQLNGLSPPLLSATPAGNGQSP